MNKGAVVLGLALAASCVSALAADDTVFESPALRPYLAGGLQYNAADKDDRRSDNGAGFYAGYGFPFSKYFTLEGNMTYSDIDRDDAPDNNRWKEYGAELNGLLTFPLGYGWVPYLSGGIGLAKNRLVSADDSMTDGVLQAGSGVFYLIDTGRHTWGFQLDAKYRVIQTNDSLFKGTIPGFDRNFEDVVVKLGAVYMLGDKAVKTAPPAPVVAAAVIDSDGDGVPDDQDACPATAKGVKVDARGCAVQDADNVLDAIGAVYFDFDRSVLKSSETAKLDKAAASYNKRQSESARLVISAEGHTDAMGTEAYNTALSERRAQVVKQYLVKKGVPAEKIFISALGEGRPAATNDTEQGRALNRRVEVNLIEK